MDQAEIPAVRSVLLPGGDNWKQSNPLLSGLHAHLPENPPDHPRTILPSSPEPMRNESTRPHPSKLALPLDQEHIQPLPSCGYRGAAACRTTPANDN